MKALLKKYDKDTLVETEEVELPDNYDGDPYGDTVPFAMASNWTLNVIEDEEAAPWECFRDDSYFGLWCVRPWRDRRFGAGFHVNSKTEAEGLRDLLNGLAQAVSDLLPNHSAGCVHGFSMDNGISFSMDENGKPFVTYESCQCAEEEKRARDLLPHKHKDAFAPDPRG